MPGPLDGIRVIEVANFIAGPYAAMLLADLGADVLKVEQPPTGDPFRAWDGSNDAPAFWAYNRGKRSITLNLRDKRGSQLLRQLAAGADVLVENMRPGVMARLGCDDEQLRQINPRLIYCAVTGFGNSGPYVERPAYDGIGQALSGLLSQLTDRHAPTIVGPNFSDSLAGVFGAYGVLGALVGRAGTGQGQRVDTSLVGASLAFLIAPATQTLTGTPPPTPSSRAANSQTYAWLASDGLPLTVHLSSPPKFWEGLARALDRPELIDDARFRTRADRQTHYDALHAELAPAFAGRPRAEWLNRLEKEDVPCAPVYDMAEVFTDPQIAHMGLQLDLPRPAPQGPIRTVGSGVQYGGTPLDRPTLPPALGEHTDAVLADLGLSATDIAALRADAVI